MKGFRFSRSQLAVLLGTALFQCALIGILVNSASILLDEIQQARQLPMSMISAHSALRNIGGAVLGPILVRRFYLSNKPVFLLGCTGMVVAGHLLLTMQTPVWLWYVIPFFFAPSLSVGVVAIPYLLRPWFPSQIGFATGFAMAFSGLGGVLFNPVIARLIETVGWQRAIWVLSGVTLVLAAFSIALIFRKKAPEQQFSAENPKKVIGSAQRLPVGNALAFTLCQLSMLGTAAGVSLVNFMSSYMRSLGYSLRFAAAIMACVMAGNIAGKLAFGYASDRFGTWRTAALQSALVAAGLFMLVMAVKSPPLLLAAAVLFGTTYVGSTIAVRKCTVAAYGESESRNWDGLHTSCNCAAAAIASLGTGFFYDWVGSFQPSFLLLAASMLVSSCTAFVCDRLAGNQQ